MMRLTVWGRQVARALTASAVLAGCAGVARADAVADFYHGKTITILVGYSAGGGYDLYARAIARHMGSHIPGAPTVVANNMPGAGSIIAANYLYNVAPKDGTVFGTFARGVAMEPLIGKAHVKYDATKFAWIGSASYESSVFAVTQKAKVKTWDDALHAEVTVGGEGSGSDPDTYAAMLKNLFDAKVKLVTGYPGGNDMTLAIERGELDGRCGWSWGSIKATRPDWAAGPNKLNVLLQMTLDRNAELPDVPTVLEKATTDRQRQIIKLIVSRQLMARPFAAPPGIPDDRKAALRKAFDDTMKDPEFIADAGKMKLEINSVPGSRMDELISELYRTPAAVVEEAKAVVSGVGAKP